MLVVYTQHTMKALQFIPGMLIGEFWFFLQIPLDSLTVLNLLVN